MSGLIPTIPISAFKRLKVFELKRLKSCEVESDGEYLFTFINPTTSYIRGHTEQLAQLGNSVGLETLEQIKASAELEDAPV